MSEQDLDEIYKMRLLLEVPATLSAGAKAGAEDLARLDELAGEIEAAADAGDVSRFLEADRRFHLDLLALAGNRRLVDSIETLRAQTRLYGLRALAEHGRLADTVGEHRAILAAIAARDWETLERLMRDHLRHTRSDWATG